MDSFSPFDPKGLARLKTLKLRAKRLVSGMLLGEHPGRRQGVSAEFIDHRPWEPGNDPQKIDWRVYARTGKFFQRRYQEQATAGVTFLLDYSASMDYHGKNAPLSKKEYMESLAAAMGYLVTRQQDSLGMMAYRACETVVFRAGTGEKHWWDSLTFLENPPFSKKTSHDVTSDILATYAEQFPKHGMVFWIGDFFDRENFAQTLPFLKRLCARGDEITLLQLADPDEIEFPFDSLNRFVSLENPQENVTLSAANVRQAYLEAWENWCGEIRSGCRQLNIPHFLCSTQESLEVCLRKILSG